MSTFVRITQTLPSLLRRWSSSLSPPERDSVSSWIASQSLPDKQAPLFDHVSASKLKALYCTLPTLDGSIPSAVHRREIFDFAKGGAFCISPGHHLIFCNPVAPERDLNSDATTRVLSPPDPLTRRMWAGGKFEFTRPIRVGDYIRSQSSISKIEAKRLDVANPIVVVEQTIETRAVSDPETSSGTDDTDRACVTETRSHVYIPIDKEPDHRVRTVKDLPKPDFSLSYTPTDTTLFRFSALTFNAHRIHLDRDYAQHVERLPERLVHGPMTAMMLLEAIEQFRPENLRIHTFAYRATNPLFVNRPITIHGSWMTERDVKVWATSDYGVVGMVGDAHLKGPEERLA